MKQRIFPLLLILGFILAPLMAPRLAVAQFDPFDNACSGAENSTVCQDSRVSQTAKDNSLYGKNGVVTKAIGLISIIVGIAAVILMLVAGFRYITSSGDAGNIASAKNTAKYAAIGLLVVLFSRGIITFVFDRL